MELSDRKKKILSAVIDSYVDTAEPVGSKAITQQSGLSLSSATIRSEMAELEAMGYLEQPHTSAGRVPTARGYRLYVNELMERQKLCAEETEALENSLRQKIQQLDKLVSEVGRLASQVTDYAVLSLAAPRPSAIIRFDLIYIDANTFIIVSMQSNNSVKNKLVHLPFSVEEGMLRKLSAVFNAHFTGITEEQITPLLISSMERASGDTMGLVSIIAGFAIEILCETGTGEAYVTGASKLLRQPEYHDPDKAHKLIHFLSDSEQLLQLPAPEAGGDIKVLIGPENVAEELKDSSVILVKYNLGENSQGLVGVVGPTRMDYSSVAARLSYIAAALSRLLGSGEGPPGGWGKMTTIDN
ncbi:MAG: heat-inducible transcriptional repressor HrcA [Firmicutes bacterium]|nr:heat-inducible transcriptional repressor HrcA [Bacillota bacterium]